MAVPEADRDAHKTPLYHDKKLAIPGIPLVDEDGADVIESEDESKSRAADRFKQSVYDNNLFENSDESPNVNSATKILNKNDPVNIKPSKNKIHRRTPSQ